MTPKQRLAEQKVRAGRRVLPINPSQPGPMVPRPVTPGNIDLRNRPMVRNPDGSISTVRSGSFGTDSGTLLLPTVVGNRVVSDDEAWDNYQQTGQNLGTFRNHADADMFARWLHEQQRKFYGLG